MKIFVHSEQVNWSVDGAKLEGPNALWIKDIEAAARGCISMREYETECLAYDAADLLSIIPFYHTRDLVEEIRYTLRENPDMFDSRVNFSVECVKNARGWRTVLDAMEIT